MILELLGAVGIGVFLGNQLTYWVTARPLIDKITRLRYDGFRPETPVEPRPKTVPFREVNET